MPRDAAAVRVVALWLPDLPLQRVRRARDGAVSDRPLAVASEGRVVCCDDAARAAGVRAGGTVAEALAACGRLEIVAQDRAADHAALRALADAVLLLAPAVEVSAPDALLLDAAAAHLLGGERALAERAVDAAADMGYMARAAVANGRAPARALASHAAPSAVVCVAPGEMARALAALPVSALGLPDGVVARLRALGIASAGALARLPAGTLAHRFGPPGIAAARLARGEDDTPLVPYAPETLPEESIDLEAPAESAEPLLFALKRLADRVAARLSGRGLGATRLRLVLKLDPRGEERVAIPLAQPTASAARWLVPAKEHLFSLRLPGAVTALRLAAVEVARIAPEQLAIGDRPEALAALESVLARLAVRLGDAAVFAAEPVERYRPESAYRAVPFRPAEARRSAGRRGGAVAAGTAGTRGGHAAHVERILPGVAEPVAVFRAPEHTTEHAAPPRPTRLLTPPASVVAEGEGGRVTALRVDGRARAVLAMEGPERLSGEWWAAAFDRDYYRVRLDGLGDCWVYRDGGDGRLYLHGFFD